VYESGRLRQGAGGHSRRARRRALRIFNVAMGALLAASLISPLR